jgi:signal transduction histidine kinase
MAARRVKRRSLGEMTRLLPTPLPLVRCHVTIFQAHLARASAWQQYGNHSQRMCAAANAESLCMVFASLSEVALCGWEDEPHTASLSDSMERTSRRAWPAAGWRAWLVAAVAATVAITCTLNSLKWIDRPFPGFFLWENFLVPAVGDTDWTGYQAGVPVPSRLIAADGEPVTSVPAVYRLAASLPVGTPVSYSFVAESGGPEITLSVPTMRLTVSEYVLTLGTYLGVGMLLTLLGLTVFFLRPDAPAARAMLSGGVLWGLYLVTAADIFGPAWFRPLCLLLQGVAPVSLLHLALTFPIQRDVLKRYPRLLWALYAAGCGIGVASNLVFSRSFAATLALNRVDALAMVINGVLLMASLAHSYFYSPSAAARQRVKIATFGGFAAFLIPIVGLFVFSLLGVGFPLNYFAMPLAFFPIAIGYAIVKHDLFEVDAIIRRTLAWAILTGVIAALYLGGVGTLEIAFTGHSGRVAQLVFLLSIVALFNPLRNRVQAAVDLLFARDRYDYRKTVTEVSQALTALLDLEAVVTRILRTITETIHVDFGAVWLRAAGAEYQLQAVGGARQVAALPQRVDETSPLVHRLEQQPQRILTEDDVAGRNGHLGAELGRLGATLLVPMTFERRLVGFLALGVKDSGHFYSREDLELLRTLASQGAVAVENARSYRALMRANEELRAAQSRLIEAERLAAIGELSAAVAHGIRNPVAGIKAAAQFANLELPSDHPLRENITDIISEADKLEGRIKTLLDFAKPFEPHPGRCRVEQIVGDALASLRVQISAQGIAVVTDLDPELPEAEVDYAQIEQVLLALLSNAVEAMPGGGKLRVSARLSADAERLCIEVADSGPGIPAEQLARVFKLFFTTKSSGTGFGLAVAKKIVERHGGTIGVQSTVGAGAHFTVELPRRLASAAS